MVKQSRRTAVRVQFYIQHDIIAACAGASMIRADTSTYRNFNLLALSLGRWPTCAGTLFGSSLRTPIAHPTTSHSTPSRHSIRSVQNDSSPAALITVGTPTHGKDETNGSTTTTGNTVYLGVSPPQTVSPPHHHLFGLEAFARGFPPGVDKKKNIPPGLVVFPPG